MSRPWEDARVVAGLARQFEARAAELAEGATAIGWKVGFGAPTARETMGTTAPLIGYLTDRTWLPSGAAVSSQGWTGGVVEFEIAVYMGADVGPGASIAEARAAVAALGPAIELADIDLPVEASRVADILAGNIFHAGVVLGENDPGRAGIDTTGLVAGILVDGVETAAVTDLQELTGPYPEVVATVAGTLAANGERLRAGDSIITGSVIPPVPIDSGSRFTFSLTGFDPIEVQIGAR